MKTSTEITFDEDRDADACFARYESQLDKISQRTRLDGFASATIANEFTRMSKDYGINLSKLKQMERINATLHSLCDREVEINLHKKTTIQKIRDQAQELNLKIGECMKVLDVVKVELPLSMEPYQKLKQELDGLTSQID